MADKSLTLSCAQSGTSFTTKLNDALEAINTMRSGPTAPTNNLEDGVMWLDTSGADKVIKIRIGGVFHPLLDFDGSNWYAERAETATKLTTARNIALTGKVTGTASFDGTANATIATTLDTSGTWTGTATSATSAGNASTSTKLATARTITLGTDLSGNVNFDGGSNVTLNATLDANTVGDSELNAGGTLEDGKVLTGTGTDSFAWETAGGGIGGFDVITSDGTWTRPAGVTKVWVTVVGGGGGGASNTQASGENAGSRSGGGGGGGGAIIWREVDNVAASVSVTVGAGGPLGAHTFGTNGGNNGTVGFASSFGSVSAPGGGGGVKVGGSTGGNATGDGAVDGTGATGGATNDNSARCIPGVSALGAAGAGGAGGPFISNSGRSGVAGRAGIVIVAY